MTFGEKITIFCKQLKWSQDDLVKKINTSAPIIERYEREAVAPSIDIVAKIVDVLNVSVDYLIGYSDKMSFDKKLSKWVKNIEALPTEEKNILHSVIDMTLAYNKTKKAFAHK